MQVTTTIRGSYVRRSYNPDAFVVVVPRSAPCWGNRENDHLAYDLEKAGVQFPLTFEVEMNGMFPQRITGTALNWTAERSGDAECAVECEEWVALNVIDYIYDVAELAFDGGVK